jgi:hypothetical protein
MKPVYINACRLRKKWARPAILWAIFFVLVASCSPKDEVAAIREVIKKGAELAEDHDVGGIMDLTTADVVALPGQHNRLEIKRIIWAALMHYGKLKVLYPEPTVDITSNDSSASARVYFLIVKKDRNLPELKELYKDPRRWLEEVSENADLYQLNLQLLKKNGDWLVKQAHLEGFKGIGF